VIEIDGLTRAAQRSHRASLFVAAMLVLALHALSSACSAPPKAPDKITQELLSSPKEVLFEKGKAFIEKKRYGQGRKYLSFVFETYPNDALGREALLLVADAYFKEGGTTGYTEARFRYRDYLNRYPGAPRRDYARYQFALCYDKEHEKPDRDQTSTREALDQYVALIREFPDTGYAGAARERIRQLTDLLAEHEFAIGFFYLRKGASSAALSRFAGLEQRFPDYGSQDKLLYYSSQALRRLGRNEEAERYRSRLLEQFPDSEWAKRARKKGEKSKPAAAASVDNKPRTN
jgi:outer membrane protein assembly factor BamD